MTNIKQVLDGIDNDRKVAQVTSEAKDEFASKPFALEYKGLYTLSKRAAFFPSLISIAGAGLAITSLTPSLSYLFSLSIGIVLGWGFEMLKAKISRAALVTYFKHNIPWLMVLAGVLYAGSVGLSTRGAIKAHELMLEHSKGAAVSDHLAGLDSVAAAHGSEVELARARLKAFENQYTIRRGRYAGQISWDARKQHAVLNSAVLAAEQRARDQVLAVRSELPDKLGAVESELSEYKYWAVGFSLFNEVLIAAFVWFVVYYRYMAAKQIDDLESLGRGEIVELTLDNLSNMVKGLGGQSLNLLPANTSYPVAERVTGNGNDGGGGLGFQFQGSEQPLHEQPLHEQPQHEQATRDQATRDQATRDQATRDQVKQDQAKAQNIKGKKRGGLEARACENCGSLYYPWNLPQRFCEKACNHEYHEFKLKTI